MFELSQGYVYMFCIVTVGRVHDLYCDNDVHVLYCDSGTCTCFVL